VLLNASLACRWDESDVSLLPEYLKKFFVKVISNFREFEDELESHEKYRNVYNIKGVMSHPSS
jgi:(-)-germacrene D synthase